MKAAPSNILIPVLVAVTMQAPTYFKSTNRCYINGHYENCPSAEQAPQEKPMPKSKYIITVAMPVNESPSAGTKLVQLETYELTGYESQGAAEDAVRRTCGRRCDVRRVTQEGE